MIESHINTMLELINSLKTMIIEDIEDVKQANHEKLLQRNDLKLQLMQKINDHQNELNKLLANEVERGIDVNNYRNNVDTLESNLKELYELNGKLASIVLPVKEMYKNIIDEITQQNGGSLVEVNA